MEITSVIGIVLGILAVFGGAILEGISITDILQPTAFIIVFGGTTGAVMLQSTASDLMNALKGLPVVFLGVQEKPKEMADMLVSLAQCSKVLLSDPEGPSPR